MRNLKTKGLGALGGGLLMAGLCAAPSTAQGLFGMELDGSLGEGGFDRYVPPVTMPVLNETPFITTELKPIYAWHKIPEGFVTDGGDVHAFALQGRLAVTDRLAIIATTDGWADVDFNNSVLDDTDGFLDLAFGAKYAIVSDPAAGNIVTVGARYTAPIGNVDTNLGATNIDLTGAGDGYVNGFVSAAKLFDTGSQIQGSLGINWGLADENWSYVHVHGHADHELLPGFFPLIEANAILPIEGGDRLTGALGGVTGADIFDPGGANPNPIFTLAIGARYRPMDNVILGIAIEGNMTDNANDADSVYGSRLTTDVTFHF